MKEFLQFLLTKVFLKNLLRALGIFVGLMIIVLIYLRIYTHHNQALSVPDFTGLTFDQAEKLATDKKLRVSIMDSVYIQSVPRGSMVEQNPSPGFKVKKNRTIFLVMNAINPEKITMPDVVGVSIRQAKAILETAGLTVGRIRYVPDIAMNEVLHQQTGGRDIVMGTSIIKGSRIDLVLGNGLSDQLTYVPDLFGQTLMIAEKKVFESYLNVGAIIYDNSILNLQDSMRAKVFRQKPEPGNIGMGSSVDIWLTISSDLVPMDTIQEEIP
jgi:eukaryotic-like serine/threonine-protein kinase